MEALTGVAQVLGGVDRAGFCWAANLAAGFPLQAEQVTNLVAVLAAYILGVALEDGLSSNTR